MICTCLITTKVFDVIRAASVSGHFAVLAADLAEEAERELSTSSRRQGPFGRMAIWRSRL